MKNVRGHDLTLKVPLMWWRVTPSPVVAFLLFAFFGAVLLVVVSLAILPAEQERAGVFAVGLFAYLLFAGTTARWMLVSYEHQVLGGCNVTTLMRLVIVGVIFIAMLSGTSPSWATLVLAAFALSLDGVDGWLARRQGLSSCFGAKFDVEVDAAFALVLAIYAATSGATGGAVILLGLPHYLFWIARLRLPWLNGDLFPSLARKAVCVFQIAVLIATQVPFFTKGWLDLLIGTAAIALILSFGRDIRWLWRTSA